MPNFYLFNDIGDDGFHLDGYNIVPRNIGTGIIPPLVSSYFKLVASFYTHFNGGIRGGDLNPSYGLFCVQTDDMKCLKNVGKFNFSCPVYSIGALIPVSPITFRISYSPTPDSFIRAEKILSAKDLPCTLIVDSLHTCQDLFNKLLKNNNFFSYQSSMESVTFFWNHSAGVKLTEGKSLKEFFGFQ